MTRAGAWALGLAAALALAGPRTGGVGVGATDAAAQEGRASAPAATAVDSLLERGMLQEAAWRLREAGDSARADSILVRLTTLLRSAPAAANPLGMDSQGVSYTWRLDHGQGVESIFKVDGSDIFCPECGADREVGAYRIDRLLGFDLTPVTVRTRVVEEDGDTLVGSTMYFVRGAETPADVGAEKPDALRIFDAIIGNSDRHASNWLIAGDRVVAIDHNRAFEYEPTTRARTCWEMQVDSIARPADLGRPWARFRILPADSFRAALAGVDTTLVRRLLDARPEIIERVEARVARPDTTLPLTDCATGG